MNSIREAVDRNPVSLISEVVLMIRSHYIDGIILIVVEGPSDKDIYQEFYDSAKFHVYACPEFSGCIGLENMLREINKRYSKKILVIKDADFDHLNNKTYQDLPNFFLTDSHDLETMMISNDFLKRVEIEWQINDPEQLLVEVMEDIIHLSYLKWLNDIHNHKLVFRKKGKAGSCYHACGCIAIQDWLDSLYSDPDNSTKVIISEKDMLRFESLHPVAKSDYLKLTNGHDLVSALSIKFQKLTCRNISKKVVSRIMKDCFSLSSYQRTKLSANIATWVQCL